MIVRKFIKRTDRISSTIKERYPENDIKWILVWMYDTGTIGAYIAEEYTYVRKGFLNNFARNGDEPMWANYYTKDPYHKKLMENIRKEFF